LPQLSATRLARHMASDSSGQLAAQAVAAALPSSAMGNTGTASGKDRPFLPVNCPTYQTLTPTGRVEAMEKRLDATLTAVKTVQLALAKFYNSLSDEQKARRSASRPA
jgi:hypothetical protein